MNDYNHIAITGNIVRDPEIKQVGERNKCNLVVCVQRQYKQAGKDIKSVDYINVVAWGKLAEICMNLKKHQKVLVDGMLQLRSYMIDKETKWITEIIAGDVQGLKEVKV